MATTQQTAHKHRFPRKLGRFLNLEGGMFGTLDLLAITPHVLELQTGDSDFIRFDRAQAENLRETIEKFLALDNSEVRGEGAAVEIIDDEEEVITEEVVTRPRRPRRPARAK
jgi:hypothetical protein